jgi:PIN domain nuclease of toxin-antitoxin system
MAAVVDTHAIIWYLTNDPRLSRAAMTAMDAATAAGDPLHVSAISLVEVLYLVEKGRLPESDRQLLLEALDDPEQPPRLVPVDRQLLNALERVACQDVPDMPDRIIAATAVAMGFP